MTDVQRDTKHVGVHHVYTDLAAFMAATHDYGTLAFYKPDPATGGNALMALHDDAVPGGAYLAQMTPAGVPLPLVVPPVPVPLTAATSHQVCHNFGFYPVVQVIDASGDVVDVDITHDDLNCFTISAATPVTGFITFR